MCSGSFCSYRFDPVFGYANTFREMSTFTKPRDRLNVEHNIARVHRQSAPRCTTSDVASRLGHVNNAQPDLQRPQPTVIHLIHGIIADN